MSKLDEIEMSLQRSLNTAYYETSPARARHKQEIVLLARAVRQLSTVHRAMKKLTHLDVMIDPDVLELIGTR